MRGCGACGVQRVSSLEAHSQAACCGVARHVCAAAWRSFGRVACTVPGASDASGSDHPANFRPRAKFVAVALQMPRPTSHAYLGGWRWTCSAAAGSLCVQRTPAAPSKCTVDVYLRRRSSASRGASRLPRCSKASAPMHAAGGRPWVLMGAPRRRRGLAHWPPSTCATYVMCRKWRKGEQPSKPRAFRAARLSILITKACCRVRATGAQSAPTAQPLSVLDVNMRCKRFHSALASALRNDAATSRQRI